MRRVLAACGWALLFGLSACGGGGGGGSGSGIGSDGNAVSLSLVTTTLSASSQAGQPNPESSATLTLSGNASGLFVGVVPTYGGVELANVTATSASTGLVSVRFRAASTLPDGVYHDTVRLYACLDAGCNQQLAGSPFEITTSYTVSGSHAAAPPTVLAVPAAAALAHDVVDAEISQPLNAIVMVSASPTNALYVYDLTTRTEKSLPLPKTPTALALSPDGRLAAVGHDARITHVDLGTVGTATPITRLLNVSAPVFDLVLDATGWVYAFPAADQWVDLHAVEVATNTERLALSGIYAGTVAKLTPSGDAFVKVDTRLSPQNLERYAIGAGNAARNQVMPYWGDYALCGGLWFSEDGATIFTACGNTFGASDMRYAGRLPMTQDAGTFYPAITGLSHSAARNEVALLDAGYAGTQGSSGADTLLRLVSADLYAPLGTYWVEPEAVDGQYVPHHGLFVFHDAAGAKWVISRLGAAGAGGMHFVSRLIGP